MTHRQTVTANETPGTHVRARGRNTYCLLDSEALSRPRKPERVLLPLLVDALLAVEASLFFLIWCLLADEADLKFPAPPRPVKAGLETDSVRSLRSYSSSKDMTGRSMLEWALPAPPRPEWNLLVAEVELLMVGWMGVGTPVGAVTAFGALKKLPAPLFVWVSQGFFFLSLPQDGAR